MGVWFDCFLFSFSLKIENGDENVFGWIFENIFTENENRKQPENENNKISFSVLSVENAMTKNIILNKSKNTKKTRSQYIIHLHYLYFLKTENKKSNQISF